MRKTWFKVRNFLFLLMQQPTDNQLFELYTIGHGNRESHTFLKLLNQYSIEVLADVRTTPYSRYNPQFRRKQLEFDLGTRGIKYLFMGTELGGRPDNPKLYIGGKLNYASVREMKVFKQGVAQIVNLIKRNVKVTLMCSESDPNDCHRKHLLADEFIREGIEVWHINKTGNLEKHSATHKQSLFD